MKSGVSMRGMSGWSKIDGLAGSLGLTILLALALASCSEMPKLAALQVPSPTITGASADSPGYRNLADLPERPKPVDSMENQETVRTLTQERAKTAEEGERLRSQPFATPEPGMRVKVEE